MWSPAYVEDAELLQGVLASGDGARPIVPRAVTK